MKVSRIIDRVVIQEREYVFAPEERPDVPEPTIEPQFSSLPRRPAVSVPPRGLITDQRRIA